MRTNAFAAILIAADCLFPVYVLAQPSSPPKPPASICEDAKSGQRIVNKKLLFFRLADQASPRPSSQVLATVDWQKLATDPDVCAGSKNCTATDAAAVKNIQQVQYPQFVDFNTYYSASNPGLTAAQYFASADNVDPITCVGNEPAPATPPTSPLDANSQIRIRGTSDDLWISRQDQNLFPKASSATVSYTDNEVVPKSNTTNITAAVGYDLLPDSDNLNSLVPYVSGNASITDTDNKPRTKNVNNFVAAGILYDTSKYASDPFPRTDQFIFKAQQVDATTMRSELTSLQAIYAPWTNPNGLLPGLNSVRPLNASLEYFGAVVFDLRTDLGYYENRGDPAFVAQNRNYARFGSRFGYSFIGNPAGLPAFTINVTETALYGTAGQPRNLSYFDAVLQVYFDAKKLFSSNFEYINGRDENTYALTHQYKAGFAAHF